MSLDKSLAGSVRKLVDCGLIQAVLVCPNVSDRAFYFEEIIDAFVLMAPREREDAFLFFNAEFYLDQIQDPLPIGANPLAHFLQFGLQHLLAPHPLIQPKFMVRARPDLFRGKMTHELFVNALVFDWCDPCPFLWLTWYRACQDLRAEEGALLHYFERGAALNLAPNPFFEPTAYASSAPDLPQHGISLVTHFLTCGDQILAPSGARFDPVWYSHRYIDSGKDGMGPLSHFLAIGRDRGYLPSEGNASAGTRATLSGPTNDVVMVENPTQILHRWTEFHVSVSEAKRKRIESAVEERLICPVIAEQHMAALDELEFEAASSPEVDILIPCYNEFELTLECLISLQRARHRRSVRITLIDDASPDERIASFSRVPGLSVIRNPKNLHFLRSCNSAFERTDAPFLLLLNNDTQVFDDMIDRLIEAIERDSQIAAAVPMFLYPNGRLQEAGGTIRFDGDSTLVGVGDDPQLPCFRYCRDVEYGSGAALMLRRAALDDHLFDERFAPAYCEDADLCLRLRTSGWRIVYEPEARIVHVLSASTNKISQRRRVQLVRENQQKLFEKWGSELRLSNRVRVLAFYLPQFHPTDFNNIWWGRGFTEWTNVTRAIPSFLGHYQPHLPADLGFYDLRRVEVLGEQQALADQYGVEGFIVYYYNFGTKRVLDRPIQMLLDRPDVDFKFALCWANENWTRHWDGGRRLMLLQQQYDRATIESVAEDMARLAHDPRAIRVNGKPLALIYRPLLIPDIVLVTERFREHFKKAGHEDVHLVYVESMEAIERRVRPVDIGFDACVEFPPQGIAQAYTRPIVSVKAGWKGNVFDYVATARNSVLRDKTGYVRYPAVVPSWDNTPRQPLEGSLLVGAQPELFQAYVEQKLEDVLNFTVGEQRLLFVNAWNEWAEGAHLEPDRAFGHRWLAALRQALLSKGVLP